MRANRHQHDPEPLGEIDAHRLRGDHTRQTRHPPYWLKAAYHVFPIGPTAAADGALKANSVHVQRSPSLKYF